MRCRTCGGTGIYEDFYGNDLYQSPCRRCARSGRVRLTFFECNVANRFWFHQPNDSTSPFTCEATDRLIPRSAGVWRPRAKPVPLSDEDAAAKIAFLKVRLWDGQPDYVKEIYKLWDSVSRVAAEATA